MAHMYPLSEGSLQIIMRGGQIENPIMQVLGTKKITNGTSDKERYRILLSDGKYIISYSIFTSNINERMISGELHVFSIIKLKRYITSIINNSEKGTKRVLVILDLEILTPGYQILRRIGILEPLPEESESPNLINANTSVAKSTPSKNASNGDFNRSNQTFQETQPISSLSPFQNKWVIKARVASKTAKKYWANSSGDGKLFSMEVIDESGSIRVTVFKDLVDKYYDMIEVDKIYYISNGHLKIVNKQFSSLKNDYEILLTNDTIFQLCNDAVDAVPHTQYNFVPIDRIRGRELGTVVDVIGVCKVFTDLRVFQAKSTGREVKKREVTLVDTTRNAIVLTLWGEQGENVDFSGNPVVAMKCVRIGEFGGGKYISTICNSVLTINPDIDEARRLRRWCDGGGFNKEVINISARVGNLVPWMSFKQVKATGLGTSEKGDYYQVKGTILLARPQNIAYKACPINECNKKVIDLENGMFKCEKCNREFPNCKYKLVLNIKVADWGCNQWISVFSSEAEKVLGMTAEEVGKAIATNDKTAVHITSAVTFKQYMFKCRAKFVKFNEAQHLKTVAVKVDPINYKAHNLYLISRINELLTQ